MSIVCDIDIEIRGLSYVHRDRSSAQIRQTRNCFKRFSFDQRVLTLLMTLEASSSTLPGSLNRGNATVKSTPFFP